MNQAQANKLFRAAVWDVLTLLRNRKFPESQRFNFTQTTLIGALFSLLAGYGFEEDELAA